MSENFDFLNSEMKYIWYLLKKSKFSFNFILFMNEGHFGRGHFGPDISATDVSATKNVKGGRFGHNHKLWVGVCACINV